MRLPIRAGCPADSEWIESFLCARWGATTIVVHGEVIDAAQLPAAVDRRGHAVDRAGRFAKALLTTNRIGEDGTSDPCFLEMARKRRRSG
jgi:hypothetical protein